MQNQLKEYNQESLLADLELPLAEILSEMEEIGIYTDVNDLQQMEKEIQEKLDVLIKIFMKLRVKNLTLILLNNLAWYYLKH